MAKLNPLSTAFITLGVLTLAGTVAWNLGLDERFNPGDKTKGDASTSKGDGESGGGEKDKQQKDAGLASAKAGGKLGTKDKPLRVSLVSFHGYAPALVANGASLTTQSGSIFDKEGVQVEFLIQDDIPTLATIFASGTAHCAWRTSDFWAQEQPNLRANKLDGRAIMVVDNTQGADAIITKDPKIRTVEDLAERSVGVLQYTPSHGMLIDAIDNSSLTARKKASLRYVFINADEGTAGVRAAFEGGRVDAAALWDPDLSLALKAVPGSRVVYSTETATNLIYDVIVCDSRVLKDAASADALQRFVSGWMKGVKQARADEDGAVDALVKTQEFFALLAKDQGRMFIRGLFRNLVWTGLEDNLRILGLAGGTNHYARVYQRFDRIYREAGALANPNAPVIAPQASLDDRFIKALAAKDAQATRAAEEPVHKFSDEGSKEARTHEAAVTKPVMVQFSTGSSELTKRAQRSIDVDMVPLIENNGAAYIEISGNTDSTGSRRVNKKLSEARADAVVQYLVTQWEFPKQRFIAIGNGPEKPLCDEAHPEREQLTPEDCMAMNRTTRAAVLSRH